MSHQFYNFDTLEEGTRKVAQSIKKLYPTQDLKSPVLSTSIAPGFLRQKLTQNPPYEPSSLDLLIQQTEQILAPGFMHWSSPKFFGYFPSTVAVSTTLAQMYASVFHTPGFTFQSSPTQTQLQTIMTDWIAISLGLPNLFLFKEKGGGVINHSASESIALSVHAAKRKKMGEVDIMNNKQKMLNFVGYFAQFGFVAMQKSLRMKQIFHVRSVPVYFCQNQKNYIVDVKAFQQMVQQDVKNGLIPFWYGSTYGSTYSNACDVQQQVLKICIQNGMWIHVDAAYLGASFICPELRPNMKIFQKVDSLSVNYSKTMLVGMDGNILFVQNRHQYTKSFEKDLKFACAKNQPLEISNKVDYKDWGFGFGRKFNSLKFFFLYKFYGVKNLQNYVRYTIQKRKAAEDIITGSGILQIFSKPQFGLICFRLLDNDGKPSNQLTKVLSDRIRNIPEGFLSPSEFKGILILRLAIGNYNGTLQVIKRYLQTIIKEGKQIRQSTEKQK